MLPKGTEEEYVANVKALQKRYDQPRRIYRAYVQDAFGHLTPRTRKGIYELITHAQESMTALRLYGGMDAGSVMVAIYEKGLDKETTKEWSAYTSRKKLQPTMEHFKEFLTQQAEELVEEELPFVRTTPTAPKPRQPNQYTSRPYNGYGKKTTPRNPVFNTREYSVGCPMCHDSSHVLYQCAEFTPNKSSLQHRG